MFLGEYTSFVFRVGSGEKSWESITSYRSRGNEIKVTDDMSV
jgi:hypothetical protein